MILKLLFLCSIQFISVYSEFYDTYTGLEITKERYEAMRTVNLVPWCAMEVSKCNPSEPRRLDATCNNLKKPSRGAIMTPFHRMLPPRLNQTSTSGAPLPPVRPLRVDLISDGRVSSKRHTQLIPFYNLMITGDITSVHDTVTYVSLARCCSSPPDPRCAPITVPDDDLHLRRSSVRCLNLTVPVTYQDLGCVGDDVPPARINLVAPLLDLSIVYGNDAQSAMRGRTGLGGRLRADVIQGKEWPPSGGRVCLNNERSRGETRCHDSPTASANSIMGPNLLFMWFYRQHNYIARKLQEINPCWDDNRLYVEAKEINIAYANQIMYYEMMPEVLGKPYMLKNNLIYKMAGPHDEYDVTEEPTVSLEYVTGTRWFHTVQEGRLKQYSPKGALLSTVALVDMTLRTGALLVNNTVYGLTQGAFRQPAAAVDGVLDPDMGERVLGRLQFASDVMSADFMKGRLLYLPSYNEYRKHCGLTEIKNFEDLQGFVDQQQIEALTLHYESPQDIELMVGITVEKPMRGGMVGPTLGCLMGDQLRRWRRADRFWYERVFTEEQLHEIRKITMSKVMCAHADGVDTIQPNAFVLPGYGNEMKTCSDYEMPDLEEFRDFKCAK